MADENSKIADDAMDAFAAGAQDRADVTAENAESVELPDDLLAEASGGWKSSDWSTTSPDWTDRGFVRIECTGCGWTSKELPFVGGGTLGFRQEALDKTWPSHCASCSSSLPRRSYVYRIVR